MDRFYDSPPPPSCTIGGWTWDHNFAGIVREDAKAGTDAKVLKAKLALGSTGPFKILAGGPSQADAIPDGHPLGSKLL